MVSVETDFLEIQAGEDVHYAVPEVISGIASRRITEFLPDIAGRGSARRWS